MSCLEHRGCTLPNGYGKLSRGGKTWLAHRWVWTEVYGSIPARMHVCHTCDNRRCINPEHLFLGTRKDNMQDMIRKGRGRWPGSHKPRPGQSVGEKNPRAKLTAIDVSDIRKIYGAGLADTVALGALYGVKPWTISRAIKRETWPDAA
jgi:hypothetical protein